MQKTLCLYEWPHPRTYAMIWSQQNFLVDCYRGYGSAGAGTAVGVAPAGPASTTWSVVAATELRRGRERGRGSIDPRWGPSRQTQTGQMRRAAVEPVLWSGMFSTTALEANLSRRMLSTASRRGDVSRGLHLGMQS
jgi:hypothetical protein